AYPETTSMKPPLKKVNCKGAPKKTSYSQAERSTKCEPSLFEHMDYLYPGTPRSQPSQKSARKQNQSPKPSPSPSPLPAPPVCKWPAEAVF
ncbi:hypothetical protein A2U01_0067455, partial [Trifolium medium]|nr:hypothetical protein [Trifolium medium]